MEREIVVYSIIRHCEEPPKGGDVAIPCDDAAPIIVENIA